MRVSPTRNSFDGCPPELAALGFSAASQVEVSLGKEYDVHAMSLFRGVLFLQLVDDTDGIAWLPAWLFDVRDSSLPEDFICNLFGGEVGMVIGPEFVAADESSYSRMVELDPALVERFWGRLEKRSGE